MLAAILTVAAGTQSVVMAQEITPDASSMSIPFSTVITLKSDGQPEPKVPVPDTEPSVRIEGAQRTTLPEDVKNTETALMAGNPDDLEIVPATEEDFVAKSSPLQLQLHKESGQPYAVNNTNIVLSSSANFGQEGIYTYQLTPSLREAEGLSFPEPVPYFLDIYVQKEAGGLKPTHYILYTEKDAQYGPDKPDVKAEEIRIGTETEDNKVVYDTHNLTLTKKVTGMGADSKDLFPFSFKFVKTPSRNKQYFIEGNEYENGVAHTGTIYASGSLWARLHANETCTIYGLTDSDEITISEDLNGNVTTSGGMDKFIPKGYTPSYVTSLGDTQESQAEGQLDTMLTTEPVQGNASHAVVFTNRKNATPTGIVTTIAPYAGMVALAGAFAFLFFRRKNEDRA